LLCSFSRDGRDCFFFIDRFEDLEEVTEIAEGGRPEGGMGLEKSIVRGVTFEMKIAELSSRLL
jgi:hypothetical protein